MPAETVYDVLTRATQLARERGDASVVPAHLTLALLDCDGEDRAWQLLNLCGIKRAELRFYVESVLGSTAGKAAVADKIPQPWPALGPILRDASKQAHDYNEAENQIALLLIGLAAARDENGAVLRSLGLKPADLRAKLRQLTRAANAGRNPLKMLDGEAKAAVDNAHDQMRASGCGRISTTHLLLGVTGQRASYALRALSDNGVDLDELARLARAQITTDNEVATAHPRFDSAAKRALERARDVAPWRTRRQPITVQALLWGLLPRPVSLRERFKWREVNDPLTRVWAQVDVATIERVTSVTLGVPIADEAARVMEKPAEKPKVAPKPRRDWAWITAGACWTIFIALGMLVFDRQHSNMWGFGLYLGLMAAQIIDFRGRLTKSLMLRSKATSFITGGLFTAVALFIAFAAGWLGV